MESGFELGRESNQELRNTPNSTTTGSPHTDLVSTTNQPSHDNERNNIAGTGSSGDSIHYSSLQRCTVGASLVCVETRV